MNQCGAQNLVGPLDGVSVQECLIKVLISMYDWFFIAFFFLKDTSSSKTIIGCVDTIEIKVKVSKVTVDRLDIRRHLQ